jgi:hypothetical protein
VRAITPDFLELDRSISGEQVACLDGSSALALAVVARSWCFEISGLLVGGLIAQSSSDCTSHVMSPSLNRGEVDVRARTVGAEAFLQQSLKKTLNLGIAEKIGRGLWEHSRSSVTEVSSPNCETKYREPDYSTIDISGMAVEPTSAFLHPLFVGSAVVALTASGLVGLIPTVKWNMNTPPGGFSA